VEWLKRNKVINMERKVPMMNETAPAHKMHHEAVKEHAAGHDHHSEMFMPHSAGHMYEQDKVRAMCGGGMSYGKKK
jgi:cellobiose-specific phosphotransferase system component IIA